LEVVMRARDIFNLIQPCKNRNVDFKDNKDGTVTLDGKKYESNTEAENYLITIPRTDIKL